MAEFEIVNHSDSEMSVSSMLSFEAYADDYALNYSLGAITDNNDTQLDGTIAAGKKMKGYIGYEVPKDWSTVEIHFTDDVWSNNKFKFEIKKQDNVPQHESVVAFLIVTLNCNPRFHTRYLG